MSTRFLVGDVFDRMAELPDGSFDLIVTSPPFLALRSYLPEGHPLKDKEIGSEATPAEYLDCLLALTAEWRRLLAPHGSIAIELGDTYAGSGGAGGDYNPDGLREGQPKFRQTANWGDNKRGTDEQATRSYGSGRGAGWPLDQSLVGIPTLYTWSLAYGRNLLTGTESPAGQWRIRNLKPWIRSNPPVGALGRKERPATSYITVACTRTDRFFDLDAVRTAVSAAEWAKAGQASGESYTTTARGVEGGWDHGRIRKPNPAGAPPLDWVVDADIIIDYAITALDKPQNSQTENLFGYDPKAPEQRVTKGTHLRRALQRAGILPDTGDYYDISPRGYTGSHYAVFPPELVKRLIDEMCPRRVCTVCGMPSRRLTESQVLLDGEPAQSPGFGRGKARQDGKSAVGVDHNRYTTDRQTIGWSDCGHNTWRPGVVLDPFVGSGTTLAVASGMGRDSIGIDIDERNAHLAELRVGMFLEIDWGPRGPTDELPPEPVVTDVVESL